MKVDTGFDPSEGKVIITVQTPLLIRNLGMFKQIFNKSKHVNLPKGVSIEANEDTPDTALILFPVDKKDIQERDDKKAVVGVRMEYMRSISDEINRFVLEALRSQLKALEFIPLHGYPVENLKSDVQNAVKGKRGFCIIKTYAEYLNSETNGNSKDAYLFHQYIVDYGTDEYTDVAINLYKGEIEELREKYESRLKLQNWI